MWLDLDKEGRTMYGSDCATKKKVKPKVSPYTVFLDIDGVLTTARHYYALDAEGAGMWASFDPVAVLFMNKLADTYDIDFVLSSTWRVLIDEASAPQDEGWITLEDDNFDGDAGVPHLMEAIFRSSGFKGKFAQDWRTPQLKSGDRAGEVGLWLEQHPEVEDYLIFDDIDFAFNRKLNRKRFIRTDADNGLLWKHMKHANSLVGQWKDK